MTRAATTVETTVELPVASGPASGPRRAAPWLLAIAAVALAAILLVAGGFIDWRKLVVAGQRLDWAVLSLAVPLSLANYLLRGLRLHVLTRQLTAGPGVLTNLAYYITGFAFLLTPGKLGEIIRLWLLKSRHEVPYAQSLGLAALDRLCDLACLVVLALASLLVETRHAGLIAVAVAMLLAATGLLASRRLVTGVVLAAHRLTRRRWPAPFRFLLASYRAILAIGRPRVVALALALSLAAWTMQTVGVWAALTASGYSGGLSSAAAIYAGALLAGGVALVPGGTDAALTGLLILSGMPPEAALVAALVVRIATWWLAMFLGFAVAPLVLGRPRLLAIPPA